MNGAVGLIGFGVMGAAMAMRLLEKGHTVLVHDISAGAMSRARDAGCRVAGTPIEVVRQVRIVLISLPKPKHVTDVLREGEKCLLAGAAEGSAIVDTSTVDPATSRQNADAASRLSVGYLDSPVLGRPGACGNWTLPIGGDPYYIQAARPVLDTIAASIIHVGPSGHGSLIKVLNNLMFGAINSITCEVFALGARLGMEPKLLFDTISDSGAGTVSNLFRELGPKIIEREFSPVFSVDNLHKDVGLGLALAREVGMTLDVSESGQRLNGMARSAGLGQEDTAAVIKIYESAPKTKGENGK